MTTAAFDHGTGIVAFVPDLWTDIWQPRHHVLNGLARHGKVLWVSPPTYVEGWRRGGVSTAGRGLEKVSDRFWAYAPKLPADYKRRYVRQGLIPSLFRRYNAWWERHQMRYIRQLTREMGMDRVVLYVWRQEFGRYVERIPHDLLCYHIDDEYTFSPTEDAAIGEDEMKLLSRANVVFIHSRTLMTKKGHINANTHYVPNGVDFAMYRRVMEEKAPEPVDLAAVPRPRIGYVGYIKRHIDLRVLLQVARDRPEWHLVLVGPVRSEHAEIAEDVAALRERPNVHFLGGKPQTVVPHYIKYFDVCLMPYRKTNYTRYIYPMKLHEYLACGKPVVATPLENIAEFDTVLRFADAPGAWVEEIEAALAESEASLGAERTAVASRNSWEARVDCIASLMKASLEETG
jgi:glycosyltransferase involved in cell wall biosynthesis